MKYFKTDVSLLSRFHFIILFQIRTAHIKLNWPLHQLQHINYYKQQYEQHNQIIKIKECNGDCCITNNYGKCPFCINKLESVYHLIMECTKCRRIRSIMYCNIMQIFNQYQYTYSLKNILFPPTNINQQHRKQIYDSLCIFIKDTKRLYFYTY